MLEIELGVNLTGKQLIQELKSSHQQLTGGSGFCLKNGPTKLVQLGSTTVMVVEPAKHRF